MKTTLYYSKRSTAGFWRAMGVQALIIKSYRWDWTTVRK